MKFVAPSAYVLKLKGVPILELGGDSKASAPQCQPRSCSFLERIFSASNFFFYRIWCWCLTLFFCLIFYTFLIELESCLVKTLVFVDFRPSKSVVSCSDIDVTDTEFSV